MGIRDLVFEEDEDQVDSLETRIKRLGHGTAVSDRPEPKTQDERITENLQRARRRNKQQADLQRVAGPVEKTLGVILAPMHATLGVVRDVAAGRNPIYGPETAPDPDSPLADVRHPESKLFGPTTAAIQERITTGDLRRDAFERAGLPRNFKMPAGVTGLGSGGLLRPEARLDTDAAFFPVDVAGDVAADPLMQARFLSMTKAGMLLRQATTKLQLNLLSKDAQGIVGAVRELADVAPQSKAMRQHLLNLKIAEGNGDFGGIVRAARQAYVEGAIPERASEQAAKGYRGLVTVMGKPVIKGAKVYRAVEAGRDYLMNSPVGESLHQLRNSFVKYAGVPEALKAYGQTAEFAEHVSRERLVAEWTEHARQIDDLAVKHGLDREQARAALFYAKEMSSVGPELNIIDFMTPKEKKKYWRWALQGNAAQQGFDVAQPRLSAALNRAAEVQARARTAHTPEGREVLNKLADDIAIDVEKNIGGIPGGTPGPAKRTIGGPKSGATHEQTELATTGVGSKPSIRTTKRGNVQTTGALPNILGKEGAYLGKGKMPDEMLDLLPDNTQRRIREYELRALERAKRRSVYNATNNAFGMYGLEAKASDEFGRRTQGMIEIMNARTRQIAADDIAAKLNMSVIGGDIEYMRHLTRPEALEHIRRYGPRQWQTFNDRQLTERLAESVKREFGNMTAVEANQIIKTQGSRITGFQPIPGGMFHEDPYLAMIVREQSSARARAVADLFRSGVREFGVLGPAGSAAEKEAVRKGWRKLNTELPDLADAYVPRDIADWWNGIEHKLHIGGPLIKNWKKWNRIWKGWTLGSIPATQTRNAISDFAMATVMGDRLYGSMPVGHLLEGLTDLRLAAGKRGVKSKEFLAAEELGVINSGQIMELEQTILAPLREGTFDIAGHEIPKNFNILSENSAYFTVMQKLANARENGVKYSFFHWLVTKKGVHPADAALRTKDIFFDYVTGLTGLEGEIRGSVIPFYAWARFNLPLQVHTLITNPSRIGFFQKLREEMAGDQSLGMSEAELPNFLQEGMPIRLSGNKEKSKFLRMESLLPVGDLAALDKPAEFLASAVTPLLTTGVQAATNTRLFGSKFREGNFRKLDSQGDFQNFLGVAVPVWTLPFLESIRPLTELNKLMGRPGPVVSDPRYPKPSLTSRVMGLLVAKPFEVSVKDAEMFDANKLIRSLNEVEMRLGRMGAKGDTLNTRVEMEKLIKLGGEIEEILENRGKLQPPE